MRRTSEHENICVYLFQSFQYWKVAGVPAVKCESILQQRGPGVTSSRDAFEVVVHKTHLGGAWITCRVSGHPQGEGFSLALLQLLCG